MVHRHEILIVEDERDFATTLSDRLEFEGAATKVTGSASAALQALGEQRFDVVLLDLGLPDISGVELLGYILARDATLPVIVVTGKGDLDTVVVAIKKGAYDFISKPIQFEELWVKIANAVQSRDARQTIAVFEHEIAGSYSFDQFIYESSAMSATVGHLKQLAESDATVLITGESGVGKELAARALHFNSPRKLRPFVSVSCAAVPETLIENELFGHERGAFTDAFDRQMGKFEYANSGTIFLDEIGDLSPLIQTKLLRVLQERSFHRIGGVEEIKVDVRVIAATNRDLAVAVEEKSFRADLYYRLSVLPIRMPALRERPEDIVLLARHFLQVYGKRTGKPFQGFAPDAEVLLTSYNWPGNVRELQNAVERAVVFGKLPQIEARDIMLGPMQPANRQAAAPAGALASLRDVEALHIAESLELCAWNISQAAAQLGIGRDTLYRKIKQYAIKRRRRGEKGAT